MRTPHALLLFCLLLSLSLSAQPIDWQPDFYAFPRSVEPTPDGGWIVSAFIRNTENGGGRPYLARVDDGQVTWEADLWEHGYDFLGMQALEAGVAVHGWSGDCDVILEGFQSVFTYGGEVAYMNSSATCGYSETDYYNESYATSDGRFLVQNSQELKLLNGNCEILLSQEHPGNFRPLNADMALLNDTIFFQSYRQRYAPTWIVMHREIGNDGFLTHFLTHILDEEILDIEVWEDTLFTRLSDRLLLSDYYPSYQKTIDLTPYGQLLRYKKYPAGLFLLCKEEEQYFIHHLTTDDQLLQTISIEDPYFQPKDFAVNGQTLALYGATRATATPFFPSVDPLVLPYPNQWLSLRFFHLGTGPYPPPPLPDLTVTGIEVEHLQTTPSVGYCEGFYPECGEVRDLTFLGTSVRVRNVGPVPVTAFTLNTRRVLCQHCYGICLHHQAYAWTFEGVNLTPGEDTLIQLPDVYFPYQSFTNPMQWCFWTSVPNRRPDRNPNNNFFCRDLDTDALIALFSREDLLLFPNPAGDRLSVVLPEPAPEPPLFTLYATDGRRLPAPTLLSDGPILELDLSRLPAGLYFLQVRSGDRQWTRRVVRR